MKMLVKLSISLLFGVSSFASAQTLEWGSFKDNGCIGDSGVRNYSSVLWNIPSGEDWMATCLVTPASFSLRSGAIAAFDQPTHCVKSSPTGVIDAAALVVGIPGLVYKPAGVVSLIMAGTSVAMTHGDLGALNVWGIFNVLDPSCPGFKAEGHIQNIQVTRPPMFLEGEWKSVLSQSVVENTRNTDTTRICFRNHTRTTVVVTHNYSGAGPYNNIGKFGSQSCANFRSDARVTFTMRQDDQIVTLNNNKQITMSLNRFAGDTITFDWKE